MLSKKIKRILIVSGIAVLSILLLAYCLAISKYGSVDNSPYSAGNFTCGDNWHGHPWSCSFSGAYKESLASIFLVIYLLIRVLFLPIETNSFIALTILVIIVFLYKYKRNKNKAARKTYDQ